MIGVCKYCGQSKEIFDAQSQLGADEKATAECGCEGAATERRKAKIKEGIKDLFGKGADKQGFASVSKLDFALIEETAFKVMQGEVRKANYDIACGDKVSIKENSDGYVVITRLHTISGQVKV